MTASGAQALRKVASAAEKAALALKARDTAICHAHAEGVTLRAIAAAAGLSHQRVHQITRA